MKELFYIKGDSKNPEDVVDALLEKYPNAITTCFGSFNDEEYLYYVNESNDIVETHYESHLGEILKRFGTEIFPKKQQEFLEKTMYQPIYEIIANGSIGLTYNLYNTIDEAMNSSKDVIGYKEIKIKIRKK